MEGKKHTAKQPINTDLLAKRMLLGAMIGLMLISFFVFQVDTNPAWGKLWRVRPLIIVPLGGATGGAFYYFMDYITYQGGWRRTLANIVSLIVFLIGLWLSFVLGLVGTLWN